MGLCAWVVAGGELPDAERVEALREASPPDFLVAADSGADAALALGLRVDVIVGDFDSVSSQALAAAGRQRRHPVDKDATDLELALKEARDLGAERITLIGGDGGRLDHFLGNLVVLGSEDLAGVAVDALVGKARLWVVRSRQEITGRSGQVVSLLPLGGPARGVHTSGLRWALSGETLAAGSTRGVSNEMTGSRATVSLEGGVLLAIQPES